MPLRKKAFENEAIHLFWEMELSKIAQQLRKLAEADDIEGLAALLESWPIEDRNDDWLMGVENRMNAPSSTPDQKKRMRALHDEFDETRKGSNLRIIRTSLAVVEKLIVLEDAGADLETPEVTEWLESFEKFEIFYEKIKRLPDSLCQMRNLKEFNVVELLLPRKQPLLPDSFATLDKLQVLKIFEYKARSLPLLPASLKKLTVGGHHNLELNVTGLTALEELYLERLELPPVGIEDLQSLKKLSWQNSECESFPEEFLALPNLKRENISLEDSEMELPDKPLPEIFSGASYSDPELDAIAQAILSFNTAVRGMEAEDEDELTAYLLVESEPASDEVLETFAKKLGVALPESLQRFYRMIGGLGHLYCNETHTISIPTPEKELEALSREFGATKSLGLIDTINESYDSLRPESEEDGYPFSQEELDTINQRFICFGSYTNSWGFESSQYLFFDDEGNFGSIYFDQNGDDDFSTDLRRIVSSTHPKFTLSELLAKSLESIAKGLRERED